MTNSKTKTLKIAVGTDNFKEMISDYDVYVDKTLFIKEILDSSEKAMLITYPRRWGKTLNLDMLKVFLEPENYGCTEKTKKDVSLLYFFSPWSWSWYPDDNNPYLCNKDLFVKNNLAISKVDSGEYMKFQGKHPVIFISLKDINGNNLVDINSQLKSLIKDLYKDFRYLLDNDKFYKDEIVDFKKYINMDYDGIRLEDSIKFLTELLHKYHGNKVYVLVDEYDKPINSFLENNLGFKPQYDEDQLVIKISKLISDILCSPLAKTNPSLEKLILTGIFDTTYKEAGSGCNNISPYGITDIKFSHSFGFSKIEVHQLIQKFPFSNESEIMDIITDWYDGYYIPISTEEYTRTYTPWAVMKYLNTAYSSKDYKPQNYWSKSGASTILQRLFTKEKCLDTSISRKFLEMSTNKSFVLQFDNKISLFKYNWYSDTDNEEFFAYLLVNSGYFAVKRTDKGFEFSIPNAELLQEFKNIIPKDNNQCSQILENLEKSNYIKAINLIKNDNHEEIIKKIENGKINCNDYSMNFNFLHLSIIYSSQNTFNALLNSKYGEELLNFKNQMYGLRPADYCYMLADDNCLSALNNNTTTQLYISNYSKFSINNNICHILSKINDYTYFSECSDGLKSTLVFLGIGTVGHFVGIFNSHPIIKHIFFAIGAFTIFTSRSIIDKINITKNCEEYIDYQSTNITTPADFKTLQQYIKYMQYQQQNEQSNSDTYVSKSFCNNSDKELVTVNMNIFENSVYSTEMVSFSLCETVEA